MFSSEGSESESTSGSASGSDSNEAPAKGTKRKAPAKKAPAKIVKSTKIAAPPPKAAKKEKKEKKESSRSSKRSKTSKQPEAANYWPPYYPGQQGFPGWGAPPMLPPPEAAKPKKEKKPKRQLGPNVDDKGNRLIYCRRCDVKNPVLDLQRDDYESGRSKWKGKCAVCQYAVSTWATKSE
jgi:hypothetical protein